MSKELAMEKSQFTARQEPGMAETVVDMLKSQGLMMSHISRKL